jgi:hypothetical protein
MMCLSFWLWGDVVPPVWYQYDITLISFLRRRQQDDAYRMMVRRMPLSPVETIFMVKNGYGLFWEVCSWF